MEERLLILLNRQFMYALLSRALCEEPDATLVEVIQSDHAKREVCLIQDAYSERLADALSRMRSYIPEELDDERRDLGALKSEYTQIFIGPATPVAFPWESMHTTGKRELFLPEVLEVRKSYRQAGFLPAKYPAVSDDFIGLEIDFMNKLAAAAHDCLTANDREGCTIRLRQSQDFLENHIFQWIDNLASSVRQNYGECFYAEIISFTSIFLERDRATLKSLLSVAPEEA